MPLGIVLASSWIETLSPEEIEDEISRSIDFLNTQMRDVPERQRSIRAVFDYSCGLLTEDEQAVFKKLAVFRGSFSRQAVQQVTGASLRVLTTLTNKSLLWRDIESARYEIHPLVRQYAESQISPNEKLAAEEAHSTYYANFMNDHIADLKGRRQLAALEEIETNFENIRAAWGWASEQCKEQQINKMLEGLHLFCQMRTRNEDGYRLFHEARDRLANTSIYRRLLPRFPEPAGDTKAIYEQALNLSQQANDQAEVGFCHYNLGMSVLYRDIVAATGYYEKALEIYRALGCEYEIGQILGNVLICYGILGRTAEAAQASQESLQIRRQIGDKIGAAETLYNLAAVSLYQFGQYQLSQTFFNEALSLRHEMKDRAGIASTLEMMGKLDMLRGDFLGAQSKLADAHKIAVDLNAPLLLAFVFNSLGMYSSFAENNYEKCLEYTQKAKALSQAQFVVATCEFNFLLAHTALHHDEVARKYIVSTIQASVPVDGFAVYIWCFPLAAVLLVRANNMERAAELLSLAYAQPPETTGYLDKWTLTSQLRQQIEAALGSNSQPWERGKSLNVRDEAKKLLEEFA